MTNTNLEPRVIRLEEFATEHGKKMAGVNIKMTHHEQQFIEQKQATKENTKAVEEQTKVLTEVVNVMSGFKGGFTAIKIMGGLFVTLLTISISLFAIFYNGS